MRVMAIFYVLAVAARRVRRVCVRERRDTAGELPQCLSLCAAWLRLHHISLSVVLAYATTNPRAATPGSALVQPPQTHDSRAVFQ